MHDVRVHDRGPHVLVTLRLRDGPNPTPVLKEAARELPSRQAVEVVGNVLVGWRSMDCPLKGPANTSCGRILGSMCTVDPTPVHVSCQPSMPARGLRVLHGAKERKALDRRIRCARTCYHQGRLSMPRSGRGVGKRFGYRRFPRDSPRQGRLPWRKKGHICCSSGQEMALKGGMCLFSSVFSLQRSSGVSAGRGAEGASLADGRGTIALALV